MATVGTGLTVTFSTGFLAEILNGKWTGYERKSIDTSHMGTTTAMTFTPGSLADPGQLECEILFDAGTKPPINSAAESVTVTYSDASTWAASGFMTNFDWESPLEDRMTATATIKFSGDVTVV